MALSGSGDTLAVGTRNEGHEVYVFERDSGNDWSLVAELGGLSTEFALLGSSVGLSKDGNVLAFGAYAADTVYLFVRDGQGTWSQQALVDRPADPQHFGVSVALSFDGGILAVGADTENVAAAGVDGEPMGNAADAGAAYVFVRDDQNAWLQQAHVKSPYIDWANHFGGVVSLSDSGDTLAVGSATEASPKQGIGGGPGDGETLAPDSGAVFLY